MHYQSQQLWSSEQSLVLIRYLGGILLPWADAGMESEFIYLLIINVICFALICFEKAKNAMNVNHLFSAFERPKPNRERASTLVHNLPAVPPMRKGHIRESSNSKRSKADLGSFSRIKSPRRGAP